MVSATLRGAEEPISREEKWHDQAHTEFRGSVDTPVGRCVWLVASLATLAQTMGGQTLVLSGAEEVPLVTTSAKFARS